MKNKFLIILAILCLLGAGTLSAEGEREARVNLINGSTGLLPQTDVTFDDGVFIMSNPLREYLANFSVPELTNDFTWSGDVKIIEFGSDKGANGVRFCIGNDRIAGDYINLLVTKAGGVAAERRGVNPMSDIYKYTLDAFGKTLENGSEFHFEIIKKLHHVVLKIDDVIAMDYEFPEEFDLFIVGEEFNLGFFASNCHFEVRNITVYDDNVVITPEPTATPVPTPSPEPTEKTEVTSTVKISATQTSGGAAKKSETGINPVVLTVFVVISALFIVTITIFIIKKKIKHKK